MTTKNIHNLVYEMDGDGDVIVAIHGLGGTSNTWSPLMPVLQDYQVIRPDLPGSGRSVFDGEALSINRFVQSIIQVLDAEDVQQAHFLGHSLGTIVCQHLAVKHPDRVKSLSLFGPMASPPDAGRPGVRARGEKAISEGVAGMAEIAEQVVAGATAEATKLSQPAVIALVRECLMRQEPKGYGNTCFALAEAIAADAAQISCPALLITGKDDKVASPQSMHALAQQFAKTPAIHTLAECGHWTTFEQVEPCRQLLSEFLNGLSAS
ncbi:alpha/beta hydrolase [Paenalcaligenes niemegkensis]|uniref:alpha/beta fold hydrolase n=1 Tax=Paenalcaligenes niemegkensis TaxID=2895469 RepID=UPI001EE8C244|nr:alpha/beta hydrolase [Paenalcaligenes niemegkensis]MCQ9616379.1 alpha/beta hydrolase [Paenalcaligenes niemegkensis]